MKALDNSGMNTVHGGKINWGDFISGACDGFFIGGLLVGSFKIAGIDTVCGLAGLRNNTLAYL